MMECVSTTRAVVLVNGSVTNEFKLGKGLCQGDPPSHFLFILVTKVLHLMLVKAEELGLIGGIQDVLKNRSFPIYSLQTIQFCPRKRKKSV